MVDLYGKRTRGTKKNHWARRLEVAWSVPEMDTRSCSGVVWFRELAGVIWPWNGSILRTSDLPLADFIKSSENSIVTRKGKLMPISLQLDGVNYIQGSLRTANEDMLKRAGVGHRWFYPQKKKKKKESIFSMFWVLVNLSVWVFVQGCPGAMKDLEFWWCFDSGFLLLLVFSGHVFSVLKVERRIAAHIETESENNSGI